MSKRYEFLRNRMMLAGVLVLGLSVAAQGQFVFDPSVSVPAAERPDGVTAADLDGDGWMDLAVTRDNPDRLSIYFNDGAGGLSVPVDYFTGSGTGPGAVAVGDLDGDQDPDVAVVLKGTETVQVWLNVGGGILTVGSVTPVGQEPVGIALDWFNEDALADLATVNRSDNTVTVLLNAGAATFTAATVAVGQDPRGIASGDLDGDGDPDLAVTNHDDRSVSILTNSAGIMTSSVLLSVGGQVRPAGVTVAELSGDGMADLAVATSGNGLNEVSIFTGIGGGAFSGPFPYPTGGQNPDSVVAADFDCDGDLDVAVTNQDSAGAAVLVNNGAGVLGAPALLATGITPGRLAAADFDGDGDPELVTANRDSHDVSSFTNQTCAGAVIGDLNCDGVVNAFDIDPFILALTDPVAYQAVFPDCDPMLADANGDGVINAFDIDPFIALLTG